MTSRSRSGAAIALCCTVAAACQSARRSPDAGTAATPIEAYNLDLTLKPLRTGDGEISAVDVRQVLSGRLDDRAAPLSFRIGIVFTSRPGIADRVDSLRIEDRAGSVPVAIVDDPANPSGYTYYRHWRVQRALQLPVTLTYRMRPAPRPSPGPQYEFYAHDRGLSAHGSQLFVLPESLGTANIRLRWNLSELPPGSTAVSSYGEGEVRLRAPADTLVSPFFLVGPLGRYRPPVSRSGFEAYWLGRPDYSSIKEMSWLYRAYENMRAFYRDSSDAPYRVFVRAVGRGGGTASGRSFMAAVAVGTEDSTRAGPRSMIAHEIGHYFVGGFVGGEIGGTPWYGEGANTHYTRLLLVRAGLMPLTDFLTEVNSNARGYYANPYRNFTADSIRLIGFSTGFGGAGAQNLAYTRGSLFWADIDARIREASEGRRKLDDILVPLLVAKRRGERFTQEALFASLTRELGPSFRAHFDAVITRGETLFPGSGAFGPCFRRVDTRYPRPDGTGTVAGVAWERDPSVPEATCRAW